MGRLGKRLCADDPELIAVLGRRNRAVGGRQVIADGDMGRTVGIGERHPQMDKIGNDVPLRQQVKAEGTAEAKGVVCG